jgi:hypothetical protein
MNRLQHETSPYLRQHAENPVDWYPWGEEALAKARAEDKPILLSVGYSACHWCHVMAHESFEDPATAAIMNLNFVNIKVDREERPDLDDIYMQATQIFQNGRGGWPMTVFLTPLGRPFHAGTYYPLQPRYGMPSFQQVMAAVMEAYQNRREQVEKSAGQVTQLLQSRAAGGEAFSFGPAHLAQAAGQLTAQADMQHGGLHRGSPKFPSPMNLDFLLRQALQTGDKTLLNIACFTLEKMAQGGIYDQVGFGFARYSVDELWLVPHFEKMLYDNAQLARVYLHAYQLTGEAFFGRICQEILAYAEREMLDPSGGFYSALDADSEGEEGKFYVWSLEEFHQVLAPQFSPEWIKALADYWDITKGGNFEGHNIPHVDIPPAEIAASLGIAEGDFLEGLDKARLALFDHRAKRIRPGLDDKILAAWNGLMLGAFAEAARAFPDKRDHYLNIARRNADFLLGPMRHSEGWLYRSHKGGISKLQGYLEDYAGVVDGLLELYQACFEPRYFAAAWALADYALAHFAADDGGAFYDTSDTHESLIARPRSLQDNAVPSGNSLMAYSWLRLGAYTGDSRYEAAALGIYQQVAAALGQYPSAFGQMLSGLFLLVNRPLEVAIIGDPAEATTQALLATVWGNFRPRAILALAAQDQGEGVEPALLAHRTRREGQATAYVCQNFVCAAPVTSPEALRQALGA